MREHAGYDMNFITAPYADTSAKHLLSGEYLVIAVASSAPPILNPSAFSQRRFAKSPIVTPALAIMNLTIWSFPPTLRFITEPPEYVLSSYGCQMVRLRRPTSATRNPGIGDSRFDAGGKAWSMEFPDASG
jgi:hypothetical protein